MCVPAVEGESEPVTAPSAAVASLNENRFAGDPDDATDALVFVFAFGSIAARSVTLLGDAGALSPRPPPDPVDPADLVRAILGAPPPPPESVRVRPRPRPRGPGRSWPSSPGPSPSTSSSVVAASPLPERRLNASSIVRLLATGIQLLRNRERLLLWSWGGVGGFTGRVRGARCAVPRSEGVTRRAPPQRPSKRKPK